MAWLEVARDGLEPFGQGGPRPGGSGGRAAAAGREPVRERLGSWGYHARTIAGQVKERLAEGRGCAAAAGRDPTEGRPGVASGREPAHWKTRITLRSLGPQHPRVGTLAGETLSSRMPRFC